MRKIILCADDFGQSNENSIGILSLIAKKRLTATSCMTTHTAWAIHAPSLLAYKEQIDIGLHFNLTEGNALTNQSWLNKDRAFPNLGKLMLKTWLGQLNQQEIENELNAQLDCFEKHLGRPVDFIDGHQHIHQLPIIRNALLKVYQERLLLNKPYIRNTNNGLFSSLCATIAFPKKQIIAFSGGLQLKAQLNAKQIPCNASFSGIYNFKNSANYRSFFKSFLNEITDNGLIMCHPGLPSNDAEDPISKSRWHELAYFSSDDFLRDCEIEKILIKKKN